MKLKFVVGWMVAVCSAAGCSSPGEDADADGTSETSASASATSATQSGDGDSDGDGDAAETQAGSEELFSFFVTSLETMQEQAGSNLGFGGDLGGLEGADAICQTAAANVGFGNKTWRAFLSVTSGSEGQPVHAIDRVGEGPWYDRNTRLVAMDLAGLMNERPDGDPLAVDDLSNEFGQPLTMYVDAHDIMTGSNEQGRLENTDPGSTCNDWTSAVGPGSENKVRCGHAWPAQSGQHWIRAHQLPGCAPGVNTEFTPPGEEGDSVGGQGGWGGIYCFALTP